jgi:hypothetical protein
LAGTKRRVAGGIGGELGADAVDFGRFQISLVVNEAIVADESFHLRCYAFWIRRFEVFNRLVDVVVFEGRFEWELHPIHDVARYE